MRVRLETPLKTVYLEANQAAISPGQFHTRQNDESAWVDHAIPPDGTVSILAAS